MRADEVLARCEYCNSKEIFTIQAEYAQSKFPDELGMPCYTTAWRILECTVCSHLSLGETKACDGPYTCAAEMIYYGCEEIIVYPVLEPLKSLESLPQEVERTREAVFKAKDIEPSVCAVCVGRTLEAVCKHEKAQGKVLADKLKYLANSGRIPQPLALMAYQLKELRNLGAHADDNDEVTEADVPVMLEFLDAILEYLYVAPAKIAAVQARLVKKTKDVDPDA